MLAQDISVWRGLQISPHGALSRRAKLATNLRWFARLDRVNTEPYYELPLPVTKLLSIVDLMASPAAEEGGESVMPAKVQPFTL